MDLGQLTTDQELLRQTLRTSGLDLLGIASAEPGPDHAQARQRYQQWLATGQQGTMVFLERHEPGKYDPEFALPGTQSVVVVGLGYYQRRPELRPPNGLVARYAWGRDYHKVLGGKLRKATEALADSFPGAQWRSFTDTAPLDERWWAARAGAAFTGRHALSIHRSLGSWFVLGEILTTHRFPPTPAPSHGHGSCPSGCHRCAEVCPTGALSPEGTINAQRCLSYLTIEHRGPISDEFKPHVGSWLFGCDLCQEVCPFNLKVAVTDEPEFLAWKAGPDLDLEEVLGLDGPAFTQRFGGSPVHRTGRSGLVRNACLVAANLGRAELLPTLRRLVHDADPGVADAAQWACQALEETL